MTKLVNRAKMSTATTGTGTITLGTAEAGYQSFADAGVVDGDVVRYVIEDGTAFEIGTGTFTATGTTLTRTVSESSNADAALNLTGSAVVYVSATAEDIPPVLELYAENPSSPTAPVATGTNAVAIGSESVSAGLRSVSLGDSHASGTDSFAAGIATNSSSFGATGFNCVALGRQARASGSPSITIGGSGITTGNNSISLGGADVSGNSNVGIGQGVVVSSSARYAVAIGYRSRASAFYSVGIGEYANPTTEGKFAFASGRFSSDGDGQAGKFILRSDTTDATPEALTTRNNAAATDNQIILPNNSAYSFSGTIIARQQASAGSEYAAWEIKGAILRDGTAATTELGNGIKNSLYASAGAAAWDVSLTADTTNGGLAITVTGAAATNIRWVATCHTSEVTF